MTIRLSNLASEYVYWPVTGEGPDGAIDPTIFDVEIAFVRGIFSDPLLADWKEGEWETIADTYYVKIEVGQAPVDLATGRYRVFLRIDTGTELVVLRAGSIVVF